MTNHHKQARAELIAEICKAVRTELWYELLLAGISTPPDYWYDEDCRAMGKRLRAVADELDPPDGMRPNRMSPLLRKLPERGQDLG